MRVFSLVLLAVFAIPAVADNAVKPIAKAAIRPPLVSAPAYDDLKRSYRVDESISLAVVRADLLSNAGRVIEIRGTVNGVMKTPAGQTVILKSTEGDAVTRLSPEARGAEILRSGAEVRVLLLVSAQDDKLLFTLLAADKDVPQESLFRSPYDNDLVVVPPSADIVLPKPKVPVRRVGSAPARVPQAGSGAIDLNAQKPAYKNLARRFNRKLSDAQADEIATALLRAGAETNIDPRFLASIVAVESDFDIYCLSRSGAMGLGQIMPFNLKEAGIRNAWNPTQNIVGMARLLRGHLNSYAGRADATLLAAAAYNAGPGAVRRAGYKVPNGAQVQRYVWKVYYRYKEFAPELF